MGLVDLSGQNFGRARDSHLLAIASRSTEILPGKINKGSVWRADFPRGVGKCQEKNYFILRSSRLYDVETHVDQAVIGILLDRIGLFPRFLEEHNRPIEPIAH